MSKDSFDWKDLVWGRHAELFDASAPFATGIWSLPDGWRETVEEALDRIATIVRADQCARLAIASLRHRHGILEINWTATSLHFEAMVVAEVDRLSARAACTCEVCGAAGRRFLSLDTATARCDTHRVRGSTEIAPSWPLIRVERAIEGGVSRITRWRIYDRGRDAFVDVAPADLGIPDMP